MLNPVFLTVTITSSPSLGGGSYWLIEFALVNVVVQLKLKFLILRQMDGNWLLQWKIKAYSTIGTFDDGNSEQIFVRDFEYLSKKILV